jgi:hypothetical protein
VVVSVASALIMPERTAPIMPRAFSGVAAIPMTNGVARNCAGETAIIRSSPSHSSSAPSWFM